MSNFDHLVYESIRSLPLMISADQAAWCLGISPAGFHRRVQDGSIRQGVLIGPRARRWEKAYIITLMQNGLPPPSKVKRPVSNDETV